MTLIVVDPTTALRDRWTVLAGCIAKQREALAQVCGCERCGDQDARQQMMGLIHANLAELDTITDAITANDLPALTHER